MENVLTALFAVFIILFAILLLVSGFVLSVDTLQQTWQVMQSRVGDQVGTSLVPVHGHVITEDEMVTAVYRNQGTTRLTDFDNWDVIIQYIDSDDQHHIRWLPYEDSPESANHWAVADLYIEAEQERVEVYDIGVLNPGEEIRLQLNVEPAVGFGQPVQVMTVAGNGSSAALFFIRNHPPELDPDSDLSLTLMSHTSESITPDQLATTDEDDPPEQLVYRVIAEPEQGELNLGSVFTQAEIDGGRLNYTHTGRGDDSFTFEVTDGKDTIGVYTFTIDVTNAPPTLTNNNYLAANADQTVTITSEHLRVADVDHDAHELTYTASTVNGTLTPGLIFTQADIDNGLLTYTPPADLCTGPGVLNEVFAFTVTDGAGADIGPFDFNIAINCP